MATILGKNNYPQGTKNVIQYTWDFGKFEIRTYEKNFSVSDSEIVKKDDKYFFNPSKQNPRYTSNEIEIPGNVIERKNKLNLDLKLRKECIGSVDRTEGKIYLSLNSEGQLIAKLGNKEAVADKIETIENKKAIDIRTLGLEFPYLEIPANVVAVFVDTKYKKIMLNCHLIYVGKSLLTGKDYYKLNSWIPASDWNCVEDLFEDFGVSGSGLNGWLTSTPDKVEATLGLKTTAGKRGHDDIKQFEDAITLLETAK